MSEIIPPLPSTEQPSVPLQVLYVPKPSQRYWLHAILFLATVFTTLVIGARMQFNFLHAQSAFSLSDESLPIFPAQWLIEAPNRLLLGIPFCATLMLILLAHEMGHYVFCRYYGVDATLPFFIPAPTLIGTLGAFIRIRSPIRSRTALFDIGIAGPIAGFVVSTLVLAFALPLSQAIPAGTAGDSAVQLGYPLIFQLAWRMLALASFKEQAASLYGVYLHPAAIAAWVGMFATALNLLPGGQLDGGHVVFSMAPRAHKYVSRLTILALIPMALYYWAGWIIWAILLRISGMRHPTVVDWPEVAGFRRGLAVLAVLMLVLTLVPAPIANSSLPDLLRTLRYR